MLGVGCNADADSRLKALFQDDEQSSLDLSTEAFRDFSGTIQWRIEEDNNELVSTVPENRINTSDGVFDRFADCDEKLTAHQVAVFIVHRLEVVYIQEENRETLCWIFATEDSVRERELEVAGVIQAGQIIHESLSFDLIELLQVCQAQLTVLHQKTCIGQLLRCNRL